MERRQEPGPDQRTDPRGEGYEDDRTPEFGLDRRVQQDQFGEELQPNGGHREAADMRISQDRQELVPVLVGGARCVGNIAESVEVTFDPETSRSIELGAKLSMDSLTGTVSLFRLNKGNILTSDIANPGFSIAVGEARSQGFEFELSGRLPGGIEGLLSYTYLDAKVVSGTRNANGVAISPDDRLLNVPKHTLSAQASRRFNVAQRELNIGAAVLHVGSRLGEVGTTFQLPAYTTVRLFGSYALTDNIEASVVVNNLFDETYFVNSYARMWVLPGAPRTALATLKLRL